MQTIYAKLQNQTDDLGRKLLPYEQYIQQNKNRRQHSVHYYNQMIQEHNNLITQLNQASREQTSLKSKMDVLKESKLVMEIQLGKIKIKP